MVCRPLHHEWGILVECLIGIALIALCLLFLQTGYIDYDKLEDKASDFRPKMIICGGSAYCREWDYKRLRQIADKVGALLMCDMAHIRWGMLTAGTVLTCFNLRCSCCRMRSTLLTAYLTRCCPQLVLWPDAVDIENLVCLVVAAVHGCSRSSVQDCFSLLAAVLVQWTGGSSGGRPAIRLL